MPLVQGQILNGRYRIVKLIGQGGFGAVYRAWDITLKHPIALKENLDTSAEAQRQFEREATLMAGLRHPNLPRIIDHFFIPGQGQYLVMDFIEGSSVAELLAAQDRPFSEAEALPWLRQVCDALDYLHNRQQPIIHRDVKPENIIITPEGQAMLVDFGISKIYDVKLATTQGARAVTPGYSPPEQYGAGKTDARTDVYALGATLYRLLTGQEPPSSVDIVAGVASLTPPRQLVHTLNPATEQAVLQAMSVNVSQRFSRPADFWQALAGDAANGAASSSQQTISTNGSSAGNPPLPNWAWAVGGVLALALFLWLGFGLGQRQGGGENNPTAVAAATPMATPTTDAESLPLAVTAEAETTDVIPPPTATATTRARPTATVTPTPTATPIRRGAWVDTVLFVEEPSAEQAINRLRTGDIDLYAMQISNPAIAQTVAASASLEADWSYGSYSELTFNPVGPIFSGTGKLNPFAVARVREAMNWLVDRDYIAQEIYGGLAAPRWHALNTISADYTDLAAVARNLEATYAYDKARAERVIGEEMRGLGAQLVSGRWRYQGQPVEIIILIRTEDERVQIGDYVANQLEDIGFTVIRDYKTAAEASPIWISGDPALGQFHIYTGGWITTQVPRNLAGNFAFFYTDTGLSVPLWQAYVNTPEFYDLAQDLDNNEFNNMVERRTMMIRALELALQDSTRVWLVDRMVITARRAEIQVAIDGYGGVTGSRLWPYTLYRTDEVGGSVTIGMPSILTTPWNPLAGSNLIYDAMIYRGVSELATHSHPLTGLPMAHRIERAEVTAQTGLPMRATEEWISLQFASSITVPRDAWIDWDGGRQRFITVGEKHPSGLTANTRSVVYYPADLYDTVQWHDGSPISAGDFVMRMILQFDRAQESSSIYDESAVSSYNSFMTAFRGVRILSQNPLIIETYSDNYSLDAEMTINGWWPDYGFGMGAWHNLAIGIQAEARGQAAFSATKAANSGVEQINYIAGPTLPIMSQRIADRQIPYQPTLGQFVSNAEATLRYNNLQEWYRTRGHLWLGTGVFYLERAFPEDGLVILQRNLNHPDLADRWAGYSGGAPRR